jgi:limonene-1,2-epoxide hydrolase
MTTPTTFAGAQDLFNTTINTSVTTAQAAVNLAAPGAVQSGIDFDALGTASLDFLQVGADAILVFTNVFEAPIDEALNVGILVTGIVDAALAGSK